MKNSQRFWRGLFFVFLIAALCGGLALPVTGGIPAQAAPQMDAASHIVISQVYGGGGNSGATYTNDFIELFNRATTAVDLTGWSVQYASATGTGLFSGNVTNLSGTLAAGQFYLVQLASGSSGAGIPLPTPDATGSIDMAASNGKVVLANTTTGLPCNGSSTPCGPAEMANIVDLVGYGTANFFEGTDTAPAISSTTADLRNGSGCNDADDNNIDFAAGPPNPRNSASPANLCTPITITGVTSSTPDNTYTTGAVIDITVTFNGQVNVAGSPTLLLETGVTDRPATYVSGSGTNSLLFNYTVIVGDLSNDLDYVANNSLSGGTINGATGEAILTLPVPGSPGSLGANQNIVIDTPPSLISFSRQTPSSATTNADTLIFRVTFSEAVTGVDGSDFTVTGTTGILAVTQVSPSVYDVTVSGGDLSNLNGTVGLNLNPGQNIADLGSNSLPNTEPLIDETYTVDNTAPSILSFARQSPTSATTNADSLTFRVTFSEAVTPVDSGDFIVVGTTGPAVVTSVSPSVYDVTISGGDLPGLNGTVGLNLNPAQNITDLALNPLPAGEPPVDETYTVNNTISVTQVVISQFRTTGPNGANDEYIELYNPTIDPIDISGWKINASNAGGGTGTRATIPASTLLRSGQYYLVANRVGYSISVPANLTYSSGIANDGGIALLRPNNAIVDQVGMGPGSAYREGITLAQLTDPDRSYERGLGGDLDSCQDTNDNATDFSAITTVDDLPRNYSSRPLRRCGTALPNPVNTTTTITAHTPNPSLPKENVRVNVRVTGSGLSPAGTRVNVTGASKDCVITLNASGAGNCLLVFTSTGSKVITARYLGNNTHLGSTATVAHQVVLATPTKIRTRTPTPAPPPPLVAINEFVPRPGHDWNHDGLINTGDEYIEILNHGVIDVNLSGYSLDDEVNVGSSPYRLPARTIKPGERVVYFGSDTGLLLSDGGDGVRLLKPNGQLADAFNYSVVRFPDQSYCRLPDNGGLDDWNEYCFPTPGLQNSLSESTVNPPASGAGESLCPISDTLPDDFVFAECPPFGNNIWNPAYWDRNGWFDQRNLPGSPGKWPVFAD